MKWRAGASSRIPGRSLRQARLLLAVYSFFPVVLAAQGLDDFRILYLEPLAMQASNTPAGAQRKTSDDALLAGVSFDAYGRRFELALEHNVGVMQGADTTAIAYRGTVAQQDGSWVRLTRSGEELHGLIADGSELYVIEPASSAREFAVAPLDPATDGNVIYRLSDTLVDLGPDFCSAVDIPDEEPTDGLTAFKAVATHLKSHTVLQQAAGASRRLWLSAIGDAQLRQRYATAAEAETAILTRLNNVDGIFSAQLGVEIAVSSLTVYENNPYPLTSTREANELLHQLGILRNSSSTLRTDGLTHLFTGRDLQGRTVGIAYIGSLCHSRYGAGLTESSSRGSVLESLIAAHEIGHNFGADHDGDADGQCAATPSNRFIMAPEAHPNNDTFSQCSLNVISRSIANASCITALSPADINVAFAAPPAAIVLHEPFPWSVTVTNGGGRQALDAQIEITLPAAFTVETATATDGNCSNGVGIVQCALGSLAAGAGRTVELVLNAQMTGSHTITAVASAVNDANPTNNFASVSLHVPGTAPATGNPTAAGAGSGGGGAISPLMLLLFGLPSLIRLRRR